MNKNTTDTHAYTRIQAFILFITKINILSISNALLIFREYFLFRLLTLSLLHNANSKHFTFSRKNMQRNMFTNEDNTIFVPHFVCEEFISTMRQNRKVENKRVCCEIYTLYAHHQKNIWFGNKKKKLIIYVR